MAHVAGCVVGRACSSRATRGRWRPGTAGRAVTPTVQTRTSVPASRTSPMLCSAALSQARPMYEQDMSNSPTIRVSELLLLWDKI